MTVQPDHERYGWRVPISADVPNVPYDVTNLADDIAATLDSETTRLSADITAVDQALTATGGRGRLRQAGTQVAPAATGGYIRVTYPTPYVTAPVVMGSPGDLSGLNTSAPFYVTTTPTHADFYGFRAGELGRVNWVADGVAP